MEIEELIEWLPEDWDSRTFDIDDTNAELARIQRAMKRRRSSRSIDILPLAGGHPAQWSRMARGQ